MSLCECVYVRTFMLKNTGIMHDIILNVGQWVS